VVSEPTRSLVESIAHPKLAWCPLADTPEEFLAKTKRRSATMQGCGTALQSLSGLTHVEGRVS
jgi:hypothetical protein